MIKHWINIISVSTILVFSSSIQKSNTISQNKVVNYNDSLIIEYDGGNIGDEYGSINAWVINKSDNCFVFPYNYGVTILINVNGNWEKIPNILSFYS
jgi:hypothetical protein